MALAVARRLHVPFALTRIATGFGLGLVGQIVPDGASAYLIPQIPPRIILFLFLPALIFEPALHIDLRQLRQNVVPVLTMAVGGTIATAGIIGLAVWWLTPLDLAWSLTLGAILSAVDPVETLAKSVFFIGLPADELQRIAAKMRPQTIPDYQFIPASDPQGQSMFVIARGIVQGSQPDLGKDGPV